MADRAERLDGLYMVLKPEPLRSAAEFEAYYRRQVNDLRGRDISAVLSLGLNRCWGKTPFKALVMGHPGVGKSTEMTRLIRDQGKRFHAIRFSATDQLDPVSFAPFDVLLLMMIEVVDACGKPIGEGGAAQPPSEERLREIWDWFAAETQTVSRAVQTSAEATAGSGISPDSWLGKVLGLFATLKGEFKYASVRESKTVTYRLSRMDTLIRAANRLMGECNEKLRNATGSEWLFVGEDFDKAGIPPGKVVDLFVTYSSLLRDLDAHCIFSLPVALGWSPKAVQLPVPQNQIYCVPDTMVFHRDHTPHQEARKALQTVLEARVSPSLFAPGQMERLIVASGGNLRDLFSLTTHAGDSALLRKAPVIETGDVNLAMSALRTDYERRLGEGPYDTELWAAGAGGRITYEQKANRLVRIYDQDPTARVPDPVLFSLLHSRAVQEFNGERWFGVHPLVVDILGFQGKIPTTEEGRLPGGTE